MNSKKSTVGDESNTLFGVPGVVEDAKPGFAYSEQKRDDPADADARGKRAHHRFPRRDRKDIPQESLAARLRKTMKGS